MKCHRIFISENKRQHEKNPSEKQCTYLTWSLAKASAPSNPRYIWGVFSITSLASEIAFLTVVRPETAPQRFVFPSMIQASISTVPSLVKTDPLPALKCGWSSNSRTCTIHPWNKVTWIFFSNFSVILVFYITGQFFQLFFPSRNKRGEKEWERCSQPWIKSSNNIPISDSPYFRGARLNHWNSIH